MSRFYTVVYGGKSHPADFDIIAMYPGSLPVRLREFRIISINATASALFDVTVNRITSTTPGSGGDSVTPTPLTSTEQAASFTARVADTTQASGTRAFVISSGVNITSGWHYMPPVELCPIFQPNEVCTLGSGEAAPDGTIFSGYAVFEELS